MNALLKSSPYLHQRITESLRGDITGGRIAAGERLPAMEEMAKEWGTSYFTIRRALAPLVREGLLEPRGKLGTVVLGSKAALTCVGIYYGADVFSIPQAAFYRVLHAELKKQLGEHEISIRLSVEQRPEGRQFQAQEELVKDIEERRIQSLIIPIANQPEIDWLKHLPIPKSYLGTDNVPWRVRSNTREQLRFALMRLKEQGVRSVGLVGGVPIHSFTQHPFTMLYADFVDLVAELEMFTRNPWCHVPDHLLDPAEMEEYGYHAFSAIWGGENDSHPEGLISVSDVIGRGVFTAILQKRIPVPKKLKLVQFKNKAIGFFTPLETSWIVNDEAKYAEALIRQVHLQMQEKEVHEILIGL